jgi:hypothetical protein
MAAAAFARLSSPTARMKYAAMKELRLLSERAPQSLYADFDFFRHLLRSDKSVFRWNAIRILGNLAPVDHDRRIDGVLDDYLAPIRGPHLIDAANTIAGAAAIALARPDLAGRIASAILKVERAEYATPECRNVAIGHVLKALARIRGVVADPRPIDRFARRQQDNPRAAVRRASAAYARVARPR